MSSPWIGSYAWDSTALWEGSENQWNELEPWVEEEPWVDHSFNKVANFFSNSTLTVSSTIRSRPAAATMSSSSSLIISSHAAQSAEVSMISKSVLLPTFWPHGFSSMTAENIFTVSAEQIRVNAIEMDASSLLLVNATRSVSYAIAMGAFSALQINFNRRQEIVSTLSSLSSFLVLAQRTSLASTSMFASSLLVAGVIRQRNITATLISQSVFSISLARIQPAVISMNISHLFTVSGARVNIVTANFTSISLFTTGIIRYVLPVVVMTSNHTFVSMANPLIRMFAAVTLTVSTRQTQLVSTAMLAVSAFLAGVTSTRRGIAVFTSNSILQAFYWTGKYILVRHPVTGNLLPCIVRVREAWNTSFVTPEVKVRKTPDSPWIIVQEKVMA